MSVVDLINPAECYGFGDTDRLDMYWLSQLRTKGLESLRKDVESDPIRYMMIGGNIVVKNDVTVDENDIHKIFIANEFKLTEVPAIYEDFDEALGPRLVLVSELEQLTSLGYDGFYDNLYRRI